MTYNFNPLAEHKMNRNVVSIIKSLFAYLRTQSWAASMWPGSGWRMGSSEHLSGRAFDLMITKLGYRPTPAEHKAAMRLVNELIANGKALKIQWILFAIDGLVTHSYNMDRGTWKRLNNRGSISANHIDHIHILFKSDAPSGFAFNHDDGTPVVSLADVLAQAHSSNRVATQSVRLLQTALKEQGFAITSVDGYYGPETRAAVAHLQSNMGYSGKDADGFIGLKSLTLIGTKYNHFRVTR